MKNEDDVPMQIAENKKKRPLKFMQQQSSIEATMNNSQMDKPLPKSSEELELEQISSVKKSLKKQKQK